MWVDQRTVLPSTYEIEYGRKFWDGWNNCCMWEGKEILIKSVVDDVSTFSMSCFKLPRGLCILTPSHVNSGGMQGGTTKNQLGLMGVDNIAEICRRVRF